MKGITAFFSGVAIIGWTGALSVPSPSSEHLEPVPTPLPSNIAIIDGQEVDINQFDGDRYFTADAYAEARRVSLNRADPVPPFYAPDYAELTLGITKIKGTRSPSVLSVFGEKAFAVCTNSAGDPSYAAARHGDGRVFAAGRHEYFASGEAPFLANIGKWVSSGKEAPRVASRDNKQVTGFTNGTVNIPTSALAAGDIDVYLVNGHQSITDEEVEQVLAFAAGGGGVLVGGQAWHWSNSMKPGQSFADFPGNRILGSVGILIGNYDWSNKDHTVASNIPPMESNLFYALDIIQSDPTNALAQNCISRSTKYPICKENEPRPEFSAIFAKAVTILETTTNRVAYSGLADTLVPALADSEAANNIKPARDVETFPYLVPEGAERVTETISIPKDMTVEERKPFSYSQVGSGEWRSTGLYAPPAGKVKYTIPEAAVGTVKFQIGCHSDSLYKKADNLARSPDIVLRFKTTSTNGTIINPWGGLIYILLNHGSDLDAFDVTFEDAVRAPHFILGKTTKEEWMAGIKDYPAPWAEIEVPNQMVWTVPSSSVRKMEDVEEYAQFWDAMMNTAKQFGGFEEGKRLRAERYVFDIQISVGWMHSGYPMMAYIGALTSSKNTVDGRGPLMIAAEMWKYGSWGPFHEIGHNLQGRYYTIGRTVETTNNWWSLVMMGQTTEHDGLKGHGATQKRVPRIHDWIFKGKPTAGWNTWLALDSYVILAEKFGWSSYTDTIKMYNDNYKTDGKIVKDDDSELNLWVARYSQVVDTNLCPYFAWWQFNLSNATLAECAKYKDLDVNLLTEFDHPTVNRGDCSSGWEAFGDSCYFFSDEKKDWFEAEATCQEVENSHLASCLSSAEWAFVNQIKSSSGDYYHWMGYNDLQEADQWTNLDGTEMVNKNVKWHGGKPKAGDRRHCGLNYKKQLEDWRCPSKEKFICRQGDNSCGLSKEAMKCDDGWVYFGNKCYLWHNTEINRTEAESLCSSNSAYLVEIDSEEESKFVIHMCESVRSSNLLSYYWTGYWLGLTNLGENATYTNWQTSGNPVSFNNWCDGEPSSRMGTSNGYMWSYYGFCWDDTTNKGSKQAVVCEKHIPAETSVDDVPAIDRTGSDDDDATIDDTATV